jgi:hypothetical protein
MRVGGVPFALSLAAMVMPYAAFSADSPAPVQTPVSASVIPSTADDRIVLSADGSSLTGTNGGGGASVGWLHNFDADTLAGVAVEHQVLATAHWTFGSINGAKTFGAGDERYSVYGEAHEGAGDDGPKAFDYKIEALGVVGTYFHRLSVQLEDRRIDIETTHGNLPKVGLSYLWNPRINTSFSYSYSINGDLGTRLAAARIDEYNPRINFLGGLSFGQASPAVLAVVNEQITQLAPGHRLKEGYLGATKPLPGWRSEVSLVADYQDLAGIKRATLTLNYIFHVGHGKPK